MRCKAKARRFEIERGGTPGGEKGTVNLRSESHTMAGEKEPNCERKRDMRRDEEELKTVSPITNERREETG